MLYRLSVSKHRDALVVKGALLFQLWTSEPYRPTRDLDLLDQGGGSAEHSCKIFIVAVFAEGDGLLLLPDTIRVGRIRDEEEYDGVPGVCLLTGAGRSHPITADPAGKFLQR